MAAASGPRGEEREEEDDGLKENKMAAASGPRGQEGKEKDDGCQKTIWPPLQGHVVRSEGKRMMAARKQDGRRFRATW